ncbi:hypothetical protein MAJ_10927, partial [Metarhizium majus ARSEF 297]
MRGKINFEEAFELPTLADSSREQAALYIAPKDLDRYIDHIKHPLGERLQLANSHGIGYTIYSLTVPGIQGIADQSKAEQHATTANDWIANEIKDHYVRTYICFGCATLEVFLWEKDRISGYAFTIIQCPS